jgi:DNA-binding Xre family transcriptional regulator
VEGETLMLEAFEVVERLKDVVSMEIGNRKVFDKDVANKLGISNTNLSTMKQRNVVPVREIALFCSQRNICINWVLFDQKPDELKEKTERHALGKKI